MNHEIHIPEVDDGMNRSTSAVSIYGQADAMDDFPVLKAFQQYIDTEHSKARKRMIMLCGFFAFLMIVVVTVFVMMLLNVSQRNQALNDRLIDFAMKDKNVNASAPVVVQSAPAQDNSVLVALTARMEQMQKQIERQNGEEAEKSGPPPASPSPEEIAREKKLQEEKAKLEQDRIRLKQEEKRLAEEKERLRKEREAEKERIRQEKEAELERIRQEEMEREIEDRRRRKFFRAELKAFTEGLQGRIAAREEEKAQKAAELQDFADAAKLLEEAEQRKLERIERENRRIQEEKERVRQEKRRAAELARKEKEERLEQERLAKLAEEERLRREAEEREQERLRKEEEAREAARQEQLAHDMYELRFYNAELMRFANALESRKEERADYVEAERRSKQEWEENRRRKQGAKSGA